MLSQPSTLLSPFQYSRSPTFLRPNNNGVNSMSGMWGSSHDASAGGNGGQPLWAPNHLSHEVLGPQHWNPNGVPRDPVHPSYVLGALPASSDFGVVSDFGVDVSPFLAPLPWQP